MRNQIKIAQAKFNTQPGHILKSINIKHPQKVRLIKAPLLIIKSSSKIKCRSINALKMSTFTAAAKKK